MASCAGTSRKYLRGPRGAGFVYAAADTQQWEWHEPAMLDVRGAMWDSAKTYSAASNARRFE